MSTPVVSTMQHWQLSHPPLSTLLQYLRPLQHCQLSHHLVKLTNWCQYIQKNRRRQILRTEIICWGGLKGIDNVNILAPIALLRLQTSKELILIKSLIHWLWQWIIMLINEFGIIIKYCGIILSHNQRSGIIIGHFENQLKWHVS